MGDQVHKKWSPVIRDLKFGLLGLPYFVTFKLCVCDKDRDVRKLQRHVNEAFFLNKEEGGKHREKRKLLERKNRRHVTYTNPHWARMVDQGPLPLIERRPLYQQWEHYRLIVYLIFSSYRGTTFIDCRLDRNLHMLLVGATAVIGNMGSNMYTDHQQWQGDMFGNGFCITRSSCVGIEEGGSGSALCHVKNWLRTHEEAQVMMASILVVVGLWWLVRAVLTLLINLVCPLVVVILAVVCVPQLRAPLLGQNYPLLANLLRNILLKMADNIRSS